MFKIPTNSDIKVGCHSFFELTFNTVSCSDNPVMIQDGGTTDVRDTLADVRVSQLYLPWPLSSFSVHSCYDQRRP